MIICLVFCFFKQKTAYDVRISDWSSDVCSSDLGVADYERTIEIYRALFGADRIAILLLEEWTADDGSFADRLSAILGIDAVTTRQLLGNRHTHGQETTRYVRSEEHTSEPQSLMRISYAVFCMKNNKHSHTTTQKP